MPRRSSPPRRSPLWPTSAKVAHKRSSGEVFTCQCLASIWVIMERTIGRICFTGSGSSRTSCLRILSSLYRSPLSSHGCLRCMLKMLSEDSMLATDLVDPLSLATV